MRPLFNSTGAGAPLWTARGAAPAADRPGAEKIFAGGELRNNLARALVGSTVDLLAGGTGVVHGIVTGVLTVAGAPRIVVNGRTYDPEQVLTATAGSLC